MRIQYTKDVVLKKCRISENLLIQWTDGVELQESKIERLKKGKNSRNVKMKKSEIDFKPSIMSYTIPLVGFSALAFVCFTKYKMK